MFVDVLFLILQKLIWVYLQYIVDVLLKVNLSRVRVNLFLEMHEMRLISENVTSRNMA